MKSLASKVDTKIYISLLKSFFVCLKFCLLLISRRLGILSRSTAVHLDLILLKKMLRLASMN
uniref:Putative ovule protein n=1 Tax=Solanum chacoense TaxID=4108 RepID=A0A0V0GXL8_SOLCH